MFTESGESRNCFQTQADEQHGLCSNNSNADNNNDNNNNNVQSVHLIGIDVVFDDGDVTVLPFSCGSILNFPPFLGPVSFPDHALLFSFNRHFLKTDSMPHSVSTKKSKPDRHGS